MVTVGQVDKTILPGGEPDPRRHLTESSRFQNGWERPFLRGAGEDESEDK